MYDHEATMRATARRLLILTVAFAVAAVALTALVVTGAFAWTPVRTGPVLPPLRDCGGYAAHYCPPASHAHTRARLTRRHTTPLPPVRRG